MAQIHEFRSLAAQWPGTAANQIPLVVRIDNEGIGMRDVENTHLDFFALYMVRNGRGIHVIDGVPHGVSRGDVYVMAEGATHAYSQHEALSLNAVYFHRAALTHEWQVLQGTPGFDGLRSGKWLHLTPAEFQAVHVQFVELRAEWLRGTEDSALLTRGLFARLLVHLCRASVANAPIAAGDRRAEREWTMSQAVQYLDERFAEPIRIAMLARRLCLSADGFTEQFRRTMGRTPRDYLRYVRIERAKVLLTTTDLTAAEIARRTGFADGPHLSRHFRSATGRTPLEFRRSTSV